MAEPWPRHPGHGSFAGLIRMTIRVFVPVGGREGLPSVRHSRKSLPGIHPERTADECPLTRCRDNRTERLWMSGPVNGCRGKLYNFGDDDQCLAGRDLMFSSTRPCPSTDAKIFTHICLEGDGVIAVLIVSGIEKSHGSLLSICH